MRRPGDVLHVYYATTESGIYTMASPADLAEFPLTAGRPMPGVSLRVVGPAARADQPCGEVGQLAILSPMNMDGYAGATADFLHHDGHACVLTSRYTG
jgi:acyl-coenzyme A synthetase/AMP-(fatty) acid ligase